MEDDHSAEEEEALTDIIQIQVFKKHKHVSYLVFYTEAISKWGNQMKMTCKNNK